MIKPLGFYVLIEPQEAPKQIGGVLLPDSVIEKEQAGMARGEIKAAGDGAPQIAPYVGRTALYGRYAGVAASEGGIDYRLIDAQDIRGVI